MRRPQGAVLGVLTCLFAAAGIVTAEVPRVINYQGRLTEADGSSLTGEHTVTFRVYDAETKGTQLWEESHPITLTVQDNGIYSIVLGSLTPFGTLDFNKPLWLALEVDAEGEMTPRQRLTAVGYAINADTLDGLDSTQLLRADALSTAVAVNVGSANSAGTSTSVSRADHVHQGVHSVSASGQPQLVGDVTFSAGSNVTLTQSGNDVQIASAAAGAQGNKVTSFDSSSVSISSSSDTSLISATITKSQASSALLVIATVQLNQTMGGNKTVDLKLFRDASQLDATYQARIGTGGGQIQQLPTTLHTWDTSGAGTFTFTLKAGASAAGAAATVRRLTVIELL